MTNLALVILEFLHKRLDAHGCFLCKRTCAFFVRDKQKTALITQTNVCIVRAGFRGATLIYSMIESFTNSATITVDIGYPMITEESGTPLAQSSPCHNGDSCPIPQFLVGQESEALSSFTIDRVKKIVNSYNAIPIARRTLARVSLETVFALATPSSNTARTSSSLMLALRSRIGAIKASRSAISNFFRSP